MNEQEIRHRLYGVATAVLGLLAVLGILTEGTAQAVLLVIDAVLALAAPVIAWWFTRSGVWVTVPADQGGVPDAT